MLQLRLCQQIQNGEKDQSSSQLPTKNLRLLPENLPRPEVQQESALLLQVLFSQSQIGNPNYAIQRTRPNCSQSTVISTDETKQSHGQPADNNENGKIESGQRKLRDIPRSWWEWANDGTTESLTLRTWPRMGDGIHDTNRQSEMEGRNSRHSQSATQNSYRSRWSVPQVQETTESGQDERTNVISTRLDSSKILELSNREGTPYGSFVYNLEVEDTHNYFANGVLVSNCHHSKGGETDAGYASADLIAGATKVIAMTGTIYNGRASSLFYLFYRLIPSFRNLYEHNQVDLFVAQHGLREWITKDKKNAKRWSSSYGYDRSNERVKEVPGVTPGIISQLLPYTVFLKLEDLGIELPSYTEERVAVPVDSRLEDGVHNLEKLRSKAVKLMREGTPGMLSQWLYAAMGWIDCPVEDELKATDKHGGETTFKLDGFLNQPDELLHVPLTKDQVILDIIKSELTLGRGCGVFFSQVNRRDWMPRMQKLLDKENIYSEILRQETARPEERERWYRECVERARAKGQEPVILANGNLVKEGLDLIELPTIIEAGIEYRINDLRQRDRRSWRLIQTRPVRVIFVYYEKTFQETALQLIAAKLKAAMMVDGKLASGLAAIMAENDDGSLMTQLMKSVAENYTPPDWAGMEQVKFEKVPFVPRLFQPELPPIIQKSKNLLAPSDVLVIPTKYKAVARRPRRTQGENVVINQYAMW